MDKKINAEACDAKCVVKYAVKRNSVLERKTESTSDCKKKRGDGKDKKSDGKGANKTLRFSRRAAPLKQAKAPSQSNLFEYFQDESSLKRYKRTEHGGLKTKKGRKNERPLTSKKSLHLVLKSHKAKGSLSFLGFKNKTFIHSLIHEKAMKFGIKIQDFANVGNHLHLKIKIKNRISFQKFLKSITSLIARYVTKARKGHPFGVFWEGLAYSRVLTSKLEEINLKGYIEANRLEAAHSFKKREEYLAQFRIWVRSRYKKYGLLDPAPILSSSSG